MTDRPKPSSIDARALACKAHAGQTDKADRPYVQHLERVAARCSTDEQKQIAWLHDILEDTQVQVSDLQAAGFHQRILDAVGVVTRRRAEPYRDYIRRVAQSGQADAITVKQADLADHLEVHPETISESLKKRYLQARKALSVKGS